MGESKAHVGLLSRACRAERYLVGSAAVVRILRHPTPHNTSGILLPQLFKLPALAALLLLATGFTTSTGAQEARLGDAPDKESVSRDIGRYVDVTIELHGLDEAAKTLNAAISRLSKAIDALAINPDGLSPEQLIEVNKLASQLRAALREADQLMNNVTPMINNARGPANELLENLLRTAQSKTIDPTLTRFDTLLTRWMMIAAIAVAVWIFVTLWWGYSTAQQLRRMAATLADLADDYEIVRKERGRLSDDRPGHDPTAGIC